MEYDLIFSFNQGSTLQCPTNSRSWLKNRLGNQYLQDLKDRHQCCLLKTLKEW